MDERGYPFQYTGVSKFSGSYLESIHHFTLYQTVAGLMSYAVTGGRSADLYKTVCSRHYKTAQVSYRALCPIFDVDIHI